MKYLIPLSIVSFLTVSLVAFDAAEDPLNRSSGATERLSRVRGLPEEPAARILLLSEQATVDVDVPGGYNIYDPKTGKKLESSFTASHYTMKPSPSGIQWGGDFPGVFQFLIVADSPSTHIRVNGIDYPGVITVYQIGQALAVVNQVSLDDVTQAMLSYALLNPTVEAQEALGAYAIAFRTKAWYACQNPKNKFWDIRAADIGYRGFSIARKDKAFFDALRLTKKLVVVIDNGPAIGAESINQLLQTMSQAEVEAMAKSGKNAKEIIDHYYPQGHLQAIQMSQS